jgi:hypothetical protein
MKRILKLDRLRLRGLSGAKDEVLLTATAQNLRRLAKLVCRAPPPMAAVASLCVASSLGTMHAVTPSSGVLDKGTAKNLPSSPTTNSNLFCNT